MFEFGEMKETLQKERELRQDTWREIVSRPGNRHRLYIVLLIGAYPRPFLVRRYR